MLLFPLAQTPNATKLVFGQYYMYSKMYIQMDTAIGKSSQLATITHFLK
jgi:hypothetical protein